jgi:hypothetical protein
MVWRSISREQQQQQQRPPSSLVPLEINELPPLPILDGAVVLRVLGKGGEGVVYLARTRDRPYVTIKLASVPTSKIDRAKPFHLGKVCASTVV